MINHQNEQTQKCWWKQGWFLGLLLVVATLVAYQPAWNGQPVYDDEDHLTPPELQSLTGLVRIWTRIDVVSQYYPIAHGAFWLEHKLWGYSMPGYHLVNILLHVFCALLLLKILKQLEAPGAWLAAAIFALHPVEVESVAWISELKNTLSTAFCLGSALAYLDFDRTRHRRFYVIALMLFGAGLLSKSVVASLPAALLVVFWWKRGTLSWKRDMRPLVPFFLVGIVTGLFTAWVERKFIGAEGEAFELTLIQRGLVAGRAIWFYLCKLCWPVDLVFIYPRWNVSQAVWWQYLFPAAALLLVAGLWALRRRWRGPLAALLFFAGTLFPALGFINVYPFRYSFVADHYQYLPGVAIITVASAGVALLLDRWRLWSRPVGNVLCVALLAVLAGLTWRQCGMYRDVETLWRTTIARNPDCFVAYSNLGNALLQKGQVDESLQMCEKALELQPGYAEPHNNLANALIQKGRVDDALLHYQKALEIRPDLAVVHCNIGNILLQRGHVDEAMARFQKAVELRPGFVNARVSLANVLLQKGRMDEAIVQLRAALDTQPDDAEANHDLGNILLQKGDYDDAIARFQKALAVQPNDAKSHNDLGNALLHKGRANEAMAHYQKALEIRPDFALAHHNLGMALLQKGQTDEAVAHFRKIVEIEPGNAHVHNNLGWMLLQAGQLDEAKIQLEEALEIQPNYPEAHVNLAKTLLRKRQVQEAATHYQTALKLQPDNARTMSNLAWVLATWPEAAVRNGTEAIQLAQQANQLTGGQNLMTLRTLAAAYAEGGRFVEATTAAQQALKLASTQTNTVLAEALRLEIKLYQSGSPFRDTEVSLEHSNGP
jgi:tetratricopeptide (TPR) repeat protein